MSLPQIAIVGRPNVGKSSLFNWLVGRRIAIVDPTPGVTRDRLSFPLEIGPRCVDLTDTGGMGIIDKDDLTEEVERQIQFAIDKADVVLYLVDVRTGPVPLDDHVAQRLRVVKKPVILVANKCDHTDLDHQVAEFCQLGFGMPISVSAQQNRGKDKLFERILEELPRKGEDETIDTTEPLKLAIVGRRNAGKSTFINCLAKEERAIVSEVEGTTRDSVDVRFEKDGKVIVAIDTAGVRYKGKVKDDIGFYSMQRAERSIRRADVVLHFFEADKKISIVDKQLAAYVLENHKPVIFVINKWDLAKDEITTGEFGDYLRKVFPSLDYVPMVFITAKEGKNVQMVVDLAQNLYKQATARVGTGELNRVVQLAMATQPAPSVRNRTPRVYYATQAAISPPTLILFTNGPELFDKTYRRYLLSTFRDQLPFSEVAIKLYLRDKKRDERTPPPRVEDKWPKPKPKKSQEVGDLWDDV